MTSLRSDSGIASGLSEVTTTDRGSGEVGTDSPDTGLGVDITRLGDAKSQFTNLYGTSNEYSLTNHKSEMEAGVAEVSNDDAATEVAVVNKKSTFESNVHGSRAAKLRHSKSYSVLPDPVEIAESSIKRRASASTLTRRSSTYTAADDLGGRPNSSMAERLRSRTQSYTNAEGVQLRGDKGRARRKSALSTTSSTFTDVLTLDAWKKNFQVPYAPRPKPIKIVRANIAPPKLGKLDGNHGKCDHSASQRSRDERPWRQTPAEINNEAKTDKEIFYEDFLPKDQWLELKPKKFTYNYKHGSHFELEKMSQRQVPAAAKSNLKKEAFVWENPHHIWLMEKTHSH